VKTKTKLIGGHHRQIHELPIYFVIILKELIGDYYQRTPLYLMILEKQQEKFNKVFVNPEVMLNGRIVPNDLLHKVILTTPWISVKNAKRKVQDHQCH
jgi:hypothetical protein